MAIFDRLSIGVVVAGAGLFGVALRRRPAPPPMVSHFCPDLRLEARVNAQPSIDSPSRHSAFDRESVDGPCSVGLDVIVNPTGLGPTAARTARPSVSRPA